MQLIVYGNTNGGGDRPHRFPRPASATASTGSEIPERGRRIFWIRTYAGENNNRARRVYSRAVIGDMETGREREVETIKNKRAAACY